MQAYKSEIMFNPLFAISLILLLAFLILFFRFVLRTFDIKRLGFAFALGHVIFVFFITILSYAGEKGLDLFFALLVFDFPITLLWAMIAGYILKLIDSWSIWYELSLFIFCGIFGSLQYYFIGKAIEYSNNKRLKVSLKQ